MAVNDNFDKVSPKSGTTGVPPRLVTGHGTVFTNAFNFFMLLVSDKCKQVLGFKAGDSSFSAKVKASDGFQGQGHGL